MTLYRVIGEGGRAGGSFWTATRPQGPLQPERRRKEAGEVAPSPTRWDRILLSTAKGDITPGTWLAREVEYLTQERGYVWVNQWSLRPGG